MTFQDFIPINDFTLIESAVQAFFAAVPGGSFVAPPAETDPRREQWTAGQDNISFYTNFNELVFQACRPRVKIRLHSVNSVRGCYALDADGTIREKAWRGSMDFGIVTEINYTKHTQLRAMVLAIINQVMPAIAADNSLFPTTGVNPLLNYHEVSEFWMQNVSTDVVAIEGAYVSMIPVQLAFSVKPDAWPAGMLTV